MVDTPQPTVKVTAHAIIRYIERVETEDAALVQEVRDVLSRCVAKGGTTGWWATEVEGLYAWCIDPSHPKSDGKYVITRVATDDDGGVGSYKVKSRKPTVPAVDQEQIVIDDKAIVQTMVASGADDVIANVSGVLAGMCPKIMVLDICKVAIPSLPGWRLVVHKDASGNFCVITVLSAKDQERPAGVSRGGSRDNKRASGSNGSKSWASRRLRQQKAREGAAKNRADAKKEEKI